jgi:hypothetical protein
LSQKEVIPFQQQTVYTGTPCICQEKGKNFILAAPTQFFIHGGQLSAKIKKKIRETSNEMKL